MNAYIWCDNIDDTRILIGPKRRPSDMSRQRFIALAQLHVDELSDLLDLPRGDKGRLFLDKITPTPQPVTIRIVLGHQDDVAIAEVKGTD